MLYAQVVVGLAVRGPFDYIIPEVFAKKIKAGMRVRVPFGARKITGYVTGLSKNSGIKKLKSIAELVDDFPVLDANLLLLTRRLADHYACFWGEAIETAIPLSLRKGKGLSIKNDLKADSATGKSEILVIQDIEGKKRWEIYLRELKDALKRKKSAIIIFSGVEYVLKARDIIAADLVVEPVVLYRGIDKESESWLKIKESDFSLVIGTRSAVFAPVNDLGLIIIDEESDAVYKQDQVPHYHARQVAIERGSIEKAKLILCATLPSTESFYLSNRKQAEFISLPFDSAQPQVKIIDMKALYFKKENILSRYLQDEISAALNAQEKVLLFFNRKGFATVNYCHNCGEVLKCPRCEINLVYHFKEKALNCHYCNFKMPLPEICPKCNAGYIKYSGQGTEKIESELSRVFPQAKIESLDNKKKFDPQGADIFIATQSILKEHGLDFGLIGVLAIDNSLNHVDLRAGEKTLSLLAGLLKFTRKKMIIQTYLPENYCLTALEKKDFALFYREELKQRRQLGFPPYQHIALVKVRGRDEEKVKEAAQRIFAGLKEIAQGQKAVQVVSLNVPQHFKLRDNFYRQILLKSAAALKISGFLRKHLKEFRHSGIIVTVDIDPV